MAEVTHEVNYRLKAKDESGAAFDSMRERFEHFAKENKKLVKGIKEVSEGFAAGFIADKIGEAMAKTGETLKEFGEQYAHAAGAMERGQAYHDAAQKMAEGTPIIGSLVKGYRILTEGIDDWRASLMEAAGADESVIDSMRSDSGMREHYTEQIKLQTIATEALIAAMKAQAAEGLKGSDAEHNAAKVEHEKRMAELTAKRKELTDAASGHEWTNRERTTIAAAGEAILAEEARFRRVGAEIDERAKHEREQREGQHQANLKQIRDAAEHAAEVEYASAAEAESLALTRKHERETDDAIRSADDAKMGQTAEVQLQIQANLRQKLIAMEEAFRTESDALEHHHIHQREREFYESQKSLSDVMSAANVIELREQRRNDEADLAELKHKHHDELEELDRAAKEKIDRLRASRYAGAEKDAIDAQQQADAQRAAVIRRQNADQNELRQRQRDRQEDVSAKAENDATAARVSLLKELASLGDAQADMEARRLEITSQATERIRELNKELRDNTTLTKAQQDALRGAIIDTQTREFLALKMAQNPELTAQSNPFAPGAEAGRGTTGIKDAAAAKAESDRAKQLQLMRDQAEAFKRLLQLWEAIMGTGAGDFIPNILQQIRDALLGTGLTPDQLAGN